MTLPEAPTLAVLPQSPLPSGPKTGVLGAALASAQPSVPALAAVYPTDASQQTLFRLPLALRQPEQVPHIAPHFVEQLRQQTQRNWCGAIPAVDTHTLDAGLRGWLTAGQCLYRP
ncbi:hypothetical protein M8494_00825 [Serratia ureilytica]